SIHASRTRRVNAPGRPTRNTARFLSPRRTRSPRRNLTAETRGRGGRTGEFISSPEVRRYGGLCEIGLRVTLTSIIRDLQSFGRPFTSSREKPPAPFDGCRGLSAQLGGFRVTLLTLR